MTFRRILHPTDFSESSRPALVVACSLAAELGAEVVVLHVSPLTAVVRSSGVSLVPADNTDELKRQLDRVGSPVADVRLTARLEHGEPDAMISHVATTAGVDLIVMGTHGRTGLLDRLLLGSVAEKVVRTARCPVMTVPAAWSPPASGGDAGSTSPVNIPTPTSPD